MSLTNGSFESPAVAAGTYRLFPEAQVPGWFTNDSLNQIELWGTGFQGVPAAAGNAFAELNANSASTLYQDVATTPGQTLAWSLKHRGRSGTDTMRVMIGAPTGTLVQNGPNLTDPNTAWGTHTGTYTVPAGQTVTRFAFQAVSAAGGNPAIGNFLDDITFGTGPCLITTKSVANLTGTDTTAEVGDTLRYTVTTRNAGGNAALQSISTDILAAGLDYVPGSLRITAGGGAGALTDATGDDRGEYSSGNRTVRVRLGDSATATAGGSISVGTSTTYVFDAKVNIAAAGGTILNEAQVGFRDNVVNQNRVSTSQETLTPVNPAADLAITKTLDTDPLVAGLPVTFTVTATNNGPQVATGVTVTDAVPDGLTDVTATSGGASCTVAATITCAIPDMTVGQSVPIEITGTLQPSRNPGASLTNTASITGSRTDPNLANNTATVIGTLSTTADVSVQKTHEPATPVAGQNVTYTLTTHNDGPSEARDVAITDPLDPGVVMISATSEQGTCDLQSQVVSCEIGTLAPGATIITTVVVRIASGAAAVVQNTASVTTSTTDPDPTNNVSSISFQPDIIADLAVVKTASAPQVSAGDTVDFTIEVSNLGASDAVNVVLADTLPAGFTATSIDAPAGATCDTDTGDSVQCTWDSFPVGGPSTVVVHAVVAADAPAGIATNTASVASPADDQNTDNNSSSAEVEVVQAADLSIQKSAPPTGEPGSAFTYTLTVTNNGPSVSRGASITDVIPAEFTAAAADHAGCAIDAGVLNCQLGDLAPGATATVQLTGTWSTTATGTVTNTATVASGTPDPVEANNTDSADVTLVPSADVSVTKTTTTPTAALAGTVSFEITVRNDGPSAAFGVVVDELPGAGITITDATTSAGSWSAAEALWTVGTVLPGDEAMLTVTGTADIVGTLPNTARASSETPDLDTDDLTATAEVVVTPSADLSITKTISANPAPSNGTVTYTLLVENHGPGATADFTIADTLPAELLNPATTTAGCSIVDESLDCVGGELSVGATFSATITGTIDPSSTADDLSNTATVTSTTPDSLPENNTSTVTVPIVGTPLVNLVKTAGLPVDATGNGRIEAGDTVAYTFTVQNTGAVTLTGATITDPLLGGDVACDAFAAPLAPGDSIICAPIVYTLTQADLDAGTVHNDASVLAQSARGTATDDAEADVTVLATNAISLDKEAADVTDVDDNGAISVGDTVDYTFTVTNTGTTTLTNAEITDAMLGGVVECEAIEGVALAPGQPVECAPVTYTLTQQDVDAGTIHNDASVTADAPTGTVDDTASTDVGAIGSASIELRKSAGTPADTTGDGVIGAGDTITYTLAAHNTGTTTLSAVTVTDPLLSDDALCTLPGDLAPDAVFECGTFSYLLTQDDVEAEVVRNTATVDGTSPLGPVTDDASVSVIITGTAAVDLTKTPTEPVDANDDGRIGADDTVTYSFVIYNTGTTVLRDIVLNDPLLGGTVDCPALDALELAPQDQVDCGPVEYALTQDDIDAGTVHNVATVDGESTAGPATSTDEVDIAVVGTDGIDLLKSAGAIEDANDSGRIDAGDTIAYTFTVTNTGTTTLRDTAITDPRLTGDIVCDAITLAPGDTTDCAGEPAVLTQDEVDAGEIVNTATASGSGTGGTPVASEDSVTTDIPTQPAVALSKTAGVPVDATGDGLIGAGDTVAYTFTVTNTGTVTLTAATITDPLLGGQVACDAFAAPLAPEESVTCAPTVYTLTQADVDAGTVHNDASVLAQSARGTATDDADTDVTILAANAISLDKRAGDVADVDNDGAISAGDTVDYTFAVTNMGTTTLTNAEITDTMLGGVVVCEELDEVELAPGQQVVCAPMTYTLTQDDIDGGTVHNDASVTADAPIGTVADTASADVSSGGTASIELVKTAGTPVDTTGDGVIAAGDTILYTFSVRNTGTTTLSAVAVTDPLLSEDVLCTVPGNLAPDATFDCGTYPYVLTQDDVEDEIVRNTATVDGTSPLGTVTDEATVNVIVTGASSLSFSKTASAPVDSNGDGRIGAGDTVAYSFLIRNTGTTVLRDVVLNDPLLGGTVDCPGLDGFELAPQDQVECGPVEYALTQADIDARTVHNVATVGGQSTAEEVTSTDDADMVVVGTDGIGLLKSAAAIEDANGSGRTDAGDTIAYTFTVTNTGTTTLREIAIVDPRLEGDIVCDTVTLAPGEATLCAGEPAILTQDEVDAGEIVNTATASGSGTGGTPVATEDSVTTSLEAQPSIALTKTGGEYADANGTGKVDAGDTVQFRFTVHNTGAVTVTDVTIDDPKLGGAVTCEIPDLAPGATAACGPLGYTLTDADASAGQVVNVATARAQAGAAIVTAAATVTVDVVGLAVTGGVATGIGWALTLVILGLLVMVAARLRNKRRAA